MIQMIAVSKVIQKNLIERKNNVEAKAYFNKFNYKRFRMMLNLLPLFFGKEANYSRFSTAHLIEMTVRDVE